MSQLRAVIGKFKADEEGTRKSFLIAQDVQAVLPEAVSIAPKREGETEDYLGKHWWTDKSPSYKIPSNKKEKVVKLFDEDTWTSLGLTWKERKVDSE